MRDHFDYVLIGSAVALAWCLVTGALPRAASPSDLGGGRTFTRGGGRFLPRGIPVALTVLLLVAAVLRLLTEPDNSTEATATLPSLTAVPRPIPTAAVGKELTAMIWTVHFALDNYGVDSSERMLQMIQESKAEVIGLLESDMARPQNGVRDIVEFLSFHLGFKYADFGPTAMDSTFGAAIISRYPILSVKRYIMPSPEGELAPLTEAVLDVYGAIVRVFVSHFGNTPHKSDLRLQSQFLGALGRESDYPSIFLGYLTTPVRKGMYHYMVRREEGQRSLPKVPGLLTDRMETTDLFKDTAYMMYTRGGWVITDAAGAAVVQRGADPRANLSVMLVNLTTPVEAAAMNDEDESGDPALHSDAFWKRFEPTKFREQDKRTDRFTYYPASGRLGHAHPRWEYYDRYCQYILYKPGYEAPSSAQGTRMYLVDWFRINDVRELSDTEIQVVRFRFSASDPLPPPPAPLP